MSMQEILDRLGTEARRLRVGQKLPQRDNIPHDLVKAVQADFLFMLEQPGVTVDLVSRAMGEGFTRGPLSRFKNLADPADYNGDLDRIVRGVNQFMETIARRREAKRLDGFVQTVAAERMLLVIEKTIELAAMGLIYGDAGRGKTLTLKAAKGIHPGAILIRVLQTTRSPGNFARELIRLLNIRGGSTAQQAQARVMSVLQGSGRALLIDEAHRLLPDTLELIRDLHDECGVPIVLVGTVKINEAVSDNDLFFGQLSSRVALRYDLTEDLRGGLGGDAPKPLHTVDEVRKLYETSKVRFTDEGRLLLTKIANIPGLGGLRLCAKIVQVARPLANGEAIDAALLLKVIRGMHGLAHAAGRIERAIERSLIRVA